MYAVVPCSYFRRRNQAESILFFYFLLALSTRVRQRVGIAHFEEHKFCTGPPSHTGIFLLGSDFKFARKIPKMKTPGFLFNLPRAQVHTDFLTVLFSFSALSGPHTHTHTHHNPDAFSSRVECSLTRLNSLTARGSVP